MGLANLGGITFRINPSEIAWNWQIQTNVIQTIGGRVVQIYGAKLSDIVVTGSFGENRWAGASGDTEAGRGWRMADAFAQQIHDLMAASAPIPGGVKAYQPPKPIRFTYMTQGDYLGRGFHDYDFLVFIRSLEDPSGNGVVSHRTGKFAYEYKLTLVPVVDNTTKLMSNNGPVTQSREKAIQAALDRISNGIGWRETRFNDPNLVSGNKDGLGDLTKNVDFASDLKAAIAAQGGLTGITPMDGSGAASSGETSSGATGTPVISPKDVSAPLAGDVLYSQAFHFYTGGHPGIDLAQPMESPLFSVADGIVVDAGPASGFGNWVVINHPKLKVCSVYGHIRDGDLKVNKGENVKGGQEIALMDSAGISTGSHLHLEIWNGSGLADQGKKMDGAAWLNDQGLVLPALGSSGPIKVRGK